MHLDDLLKIHVNNPQIVLLGRVVGVVPESKSLYVLIRNAQFLEHIGKNINVRGLKEVVILLPWRFCVGHNYRLYRSRYLLYNIVKRRRASNLIKRTYLEYAWRCPNGSLYRKLCENYQKRS